MKEQILMPINLLSLNKGKYGDVLQALSLIDEASKVCKIDLNVKKAINISTKEDFLYKYNTFEKVLNFISMNCIYNRKIETISVTGNYFESEIINKVTSGCSINASSFEFFNRVVWFFIINFYSSKLGKKEVEAEISFPNSEIIEIYGEINDEIIKEFINDFSLWLAYNAIGIIEGDIILRENNIKVKFNILL